MFVGGMIILLGDKESCCKERPRKERSMLRR